MPYQGTNAAAFSKVFFLAKTTSSKEEFPKIIPTLLTRMKRQDAEKHN